MRRCDLLLQLDDIHDGGGVRSNPRAGNQRQEIDGAKSLPGSASSCVARSTGPFTCLAYPDDVGPLPPSRAQSRGSRRLRTHVTSITRIALPRRTLCLQMHACWHARELSLTALCFCSSVPRLYQHRLHFRLGTPLQYLMYSA
jgi:hypothetical protein